MSHAGTLDRIKAHVAAQAAADAAFRAALLADPKAAVARLLGADLPAHVTIRVVEEAPDAYVVVLPAPASGELSDADLEGVAGGAAKVPGSPEAQQASAFFGAGIALAVQVGGHIKRASGDQKGYDDAEYNARKIFTCGAG